MKLKIGILALFCISLAPACFSQSIFSGSWLRKQLYPIAGPLYGNAIQAEMHIKFTQDSMIIEMTTPAPGGKTTQSRQVYLLNGKPFNTVSAVSQRKLLKTYAISPDKKSLILTTIFYSPDNDTEEDFRRVETWMMENGQLVINKKSIETRGESWEVKGVFDQF